MSICLYLLRIRTEKWLCCVRPKALAWQTVCELTDSGCLRRNKRNRKYVDYIWHFFSGYGN